MILLIGFVLLLLFFVFCVMQLAGLESLQDDQDRIARMFGESGTAAAETSHPPFWKGFLIGGALGSPIVMVYILYRVLKAKN
jgi:hypothetical protein